MSDLPFPDTPRVDAYDKVRGKPHLRRRRCPARHCCMPRLAVSTIAKGHIVSSRYQRRRAPCQASGWCSPMRPSGAVKSAGFIMGGGYGFQSFQPMLSPAIAYRGQPIALVAADTLEAAIEAAHLVTAELCGGALQRHARCAGHGDRQSGRHAAEEFHPRDHRGRCRQGLRAKRQSRSRRYSPVRHSTRTRSS